MITLVRQEKLDIPFYSDFIKKGYFRSYGNIDVEFCLINNEQYIDFEIKMNGRLAEQSLLKNSERNYLILINKLKKVAGFKNER